MLKENVKRENHLFIDAVGLGKLTYGTKKTVQHAERNRVFKSRIARMLDKSAKKRGFCGTIP